MKNRFNKKELLKKLTLSICKKEQAILLEYSVNPRPRWGHGKPPHPKLYDIINRHRDVYKDYLNRFLKYKDFFTDIGVKKNPGDPGAPAWLNDMLPGLDAVAIYGFLCLNNPERYFEIGSGNSTKFARQAIKDHNLRTKITSFEPHLRPEIRSICDAVIMRPVEDVDPAVFEELDAGDILFVDNSHRIFMNSDATAVFLDILPRLKKGVYAGFHDIWLPYDYNPEIAERYYSEQYLLAAYLLAEGNKFDIMLPNRFITDDPELSGIMAPLWNSPGMAGIYTGGGSFWIRMK